MESPNASREPHVSTDRNDRFNRRSLTQVLQAFSILESSDLNKAQVVGNLRTVLDEFTDDQIEMLADSIEGVLPLILALVQKTGLETYLKDVSKSN